MTTETVRGTERATPSQRLSRLPASRRSKLAILALWIVIAAIAGPLAIKLTQVQNNDQLVALPAGAEAHIAAARAAAAFPARDALVAVAVYVRDTGLTAADRSKAEADRTAVARYAEGRSGRAGRAERRRQGTAVVVRTLR